MREGTNQAERQRLTEAELGDVAWRRWGPYLSERQWGTVREDYGGGDAWSSFTHDQARSRAYRWGADGLAGFSDDRQLLHTYPQAEFPYQDLVAVNWARGRADPEYELLDTVVFDGNRCFDVAVEYAKATPEDLLMRGHRVAHDRPSRRDRVRTGR